MNSDKLDRFKELLDLRHKWPCNYLFKFIVRSESVQMACKVFEGNKISFKESSQGKYVSLTFTANVNSSDEVLGVYEKASKIPGLISL